MSEKIFAADEAAEIVISEIPLESEQKAIVGIENIEKDSVVMVKMAESLMQNPDDEEAAGTLIDLVSPYLEFPQLLDSTLGKLMKCLTQSCMNAFGKQFPEMVYICIYTLSNIRGFRELLPLFPNQVEIFEPVTKAFCQDIEMWEVRFVLCLWLSQLSLVPFDISTIGVSFASDLITWAKKLLDSPTRESEVSAFFLSRLLARKDMVEHRKQFIYDACKNLKENSERLITSYLRCLYYIFNGADRSWVPEFGQMVYDATAPLAESPSAHHRLFHLKIIQQIGVAYLPPRVAQWRYQRGSRTLKLGEQVQETEKSLQEDEFYKNEDKFYVEPLVEDILSLLFNSLESHLTVVRWSAAKGVGRIVERLPFEDASQAVEYLFSLFDQMDNDNLIHGACLCLAQFTLRGIILPSNLSIVIPIVMKALVYDVAHGLHTVAEGVRDSGCFVCWALARSYDGPTLEQYCPDLSQQLVNVFLLDRCVNVRRSASAAFQENVGRHGRFPHGLELIHIADFITVSSRVGCYIRIAKFVAQFPEYGPSLVHHLVNDRLKHWDIEVRTLAAQCIAILASDYPELITSDTIDEICISCCAIDIDVKHGGLEALGDLLHVRKLDAEQIEPLLTLDENYQIDSIKCSFIKMVAAAMKSGFKVPRFAELMNSWLQTGTTEVQVAVVNSLIYLNESENHILDDTFFRSLLSSIENPGVASSISAFPKWFVTPNIDEILEKFKAIFASKSAQTETKKNLMKCVAYLSRYCSNESTIALLTLGLNDRTITKKGDEGSHIRIESLRAIASLIKENHFGNAVLLDVIKLCLDRITGIRDLSVVVLQMLVDSTPDLLFKENIIKLLETKNLSVEHFNQLIVVPDFAGIVVEGLIYCSGALAPDLSKRARNSLLSFMRKKGTNNAALVSSIMIELYRKQWGIIIFHTSLFAFLPLLIGNGVLNGQNLNQFASSFLEISQNRYFVKKTPQKLSRICPVLSAFAAFCDGEQMSKAFSLLAPFFVSEVPTLRDASANELYSNLKARTSSGATLPFDFLAIEEVLTKTAWKINFEQCVEGIKKLCAFYGIEVPEIQHQQAPEQGEKDQYSYRLLAKSMY